MAESNKLTFTYRELDLFHNVLNEVVNGFKVEDHESIIGLQKNKLREMLQSTRDLPKDIEVTPDPMVIVVFRNALRVTLVHLGIHDFQTRTGYATSTAYEILKKLDEYGTSPGAPGLS